MSDRFEKIAILGVGLLGASLGAALRRRGLASCVFGVGRRPQNLQAALERGCVDQAGSDPLEALRDADLVVFATPVDAFAELFEVTARGAPPEAIVTDVGSVKRSVCRAAAGAGLAARFVGAHPMAGGTQTGALYADAALFEGKVVALTPQADSDPRAVERVSGMWQGVGAEVLPMTADEHDHVVAASSHLPQMIATALAASCAEHDRPELFERLRAGGFASVTRTAGSDPAMWRAIVEANGDEIAAAMQGFERLWRRLREAVQGGDLEAVEAVMRAAAVFKNRLKNRP